MLKNVVNKLQEDVGSLQEAKLFGTILKMEMPSGASLEEKIAGNYKLYITEFVERMKEGQKPGEFIPEMEGRFRETIKNLTDKADMVFTYKGGTYYGGMGGK